MSADGRALAEKLVRDGSLAEAEYRELLENRTDAVRAYLAEEAVRVRERIYGKDVYVRGLIEISNICRNDCLYCGIRRSNRCVERYRLSPEEILECAEEGYALGFRTFVMQGGEDAWYTDERLAALIREMKRRHPDAAVTLSLGERSFESYQALREAGADRYLLRHETADEAHYGRLHPPEMSWKKRMQCLKDLKRLGFQVGCGFMVGSPYQTAAHLAKDLAFIGEFRPDLPATTALGTIDPQGRELGILAGANVVMPNLSPQEVRDQYNLYDHKISTGEESAQCLSALRARMQSVGYQVVTARGDVKRGKENF